MERTPRTCQSFQSETLERQIAMLEQQHIDVANRLRELRARLRELERSQPPGDRPPRDGHAD